MSNGQPDVYSQSGDGTDNWWSRWSDVDSDESADDIDDRQDVDNDNNHLIDNILDDNNDDDEDDYIGYDGVGNGIVGDATDESDINITMNSMKLTIMSTNIILRMMKRMISNTTLLITLTIITFLPIR